MVRMMIDSDIGQIMEQLKQIHGTSLKSFHTALLDALPDKEMVRSQLFNYSVAIYGYYENDRLLGIVYYQLPGVISFQNSATIYWISCAEMQENSFKTLLNASAEDLFHRSGISKLKIHFAKSLFPEINLESELAEYGFVKEAEIEHGVGWQNNLLVFSLLNRSYDDKCN